MFLSQESMVGVEDLAGASCTVVCGHKVPQMGRIGILEKIG